jgi:hypothetical protein
MGYPTKVQLIQRKESQQWYINFPAAIAQAMDFSKGEDVQWTVADKGHLILSRDQVPPNPIDLKKTPGLLRTAHHYRFVAPAGSYPTGLDGRLSVLRPGPF